MQAFFCHDDTRQKSLDYYPTPVSFTLGPGSYHLAWLEAELTRLYQGLAHHMQAI